MSMCLTHLLLQSLTATIMLKLISLIPYQTKWDIRVNRAVVPRMIAVYIYDVRVTVLLIEIKVGDNVMNAFHHKHII